MKVVLSLLHTYTFTLKSKSHEGLFFLKNIFGAVDARGRNRHRKTHFLFSTGNSVKLGQLERVSGLCRLYDISAYVIIELHIQLEFYLKFKRNSHTVNRILNNAIIIV